ncbi:hypothetical protein [Nocardioides sp. LML1-1-1.1]|uniref:hypothetical protein n=1 Tax=Nocardioides sp. LML1-1-1.1 TaxID=3135248 RepID=UPI003432A93B
MRRAGLLAPLLLVPLAACGAGDPPYTGLAEAVCDGLGAPALVRSSYPGMTVSAEETVEGTGRDATRVCGIELGAQDGRTLSISVELELFGEDVPDEDFERLASIDVADYQDDGAEQGAGHESATEGWWAEGLHRETSWTDPRGDGGVGGYLGTDAVRRDNLLVTVLVIDRDNPVTDPRAIAATHAKVVSALLERAEDLARRD